MRVFVTGATGFIGSAIVQELLKGGHDVIGLARSDASAKALSALGAQVHRGTIEDLESLRHAASTADGAIHTAFFHAFSQASLSTRLRVVFGGSPTGMVSRFMRAANLADRSVIETLGAALCGRERSLVVAFPTMAMSPGRIAVETEPPNPTSVGGLRVPSEAATLAFAARGVRASVVRLPPSVHDHCKQGLVTQMIALARQKHVSPYVDDGRNRWAAVHRTDAAKLFRLALERGEPGARYHAVAEEGIPVREIAELIGRRLGVPVISKTSEAAGYFGWLAPFLSADNPVSSQRTRDLLGWQPMGPGLFQDIERAIDQTA